MGLTETIFASGRIVSLILVPVFRELAAILLAFAISKDCKARNNGSGVLWGIFTLITPIFAGIVYALYSRFLVKRKPETAEDKKRVKSSRKLTCAAVLIYVLSIIIALVALITNIASGIAMHSSENHKGFISAILEEAYFDRNGVKYDSREEVPLYDEYGNKYHYAKSSNGFNYYTYFDENDTEYDLAYCYISMDGYFYYDKDDSLTVERSFLENDVYYDSSGNEYALIELYVYWDEDGKIITHYGKGDIYAFE